MIIITFYKNECAVKTVLVKQEYNKQNLLNLTHDIAKRLFESDLSFHKYEFHNSENIYEWSSNKILL